MNSLLKYKTINHCMLHHKILAKLIKCAIGFTSKLINVKYLYSVYYNLLILLFQDNISSILPFDSFSEN
jgi:hypothetical protein